MGAQLQSWNNGGFFFSFSNYETHLDEPQELLADELQHVCRRGRRQVLDQQQLVWRVLRRLHSQTEFRINKYFK